MSETNGFQIVDRPQVLGRRASKTIHETAAVLATETSGRAVMLQSREAMMRVRGRVMETLRRHRPDLMVRNAGNAIWVEKREAAR